MVNNHVTLLGVRVDNIDLDGVLAHIERAICAKEKVIISNVNIYALNLSYEIKWFREFLNSSEIVFCDGFGVILGALLTGQKLNNRLTPPDWIDLLCRQAQKHCWNLFFLGGRPGISAIASQNLKLRYPGLTINSHHGYFDHNGSDNQKVIELIEESKSQIILAGMGMPLQEKWIKENYEIIQNGYVFLPVGALFDYVAETIPRGPKFLTDHGLEWLSRLIIEPKRLWHRYLIGNPKFFIRLLLWALKEKYI